MAVRSNPYAQLIRNSDQNPDDKSEGTLWKLCEKLSTDSEKCLCEGKRSTHAWYTQSVNNEIHHGPGCIDTITYGDGDKCLLSTICQNRFPEDFEWPTCRDGNSCMYPLWVGKGSGFEVLDDDTKACREWDCVMDETDTPPKWHSGENSAEHLEQWRNYVNTQFEN